jgi:hypothetical protein
VRNLYQQGAYPWVTGAQTVNLGEPGPRTNLEVQSAYPRTWPAQYRWSLMGLGGMPLFQLGVTAPTFNNNYAPYSPGYNVMTPGLTKLPYGS